MEFDWKSPNYALVYEQRAERLSNIRATPEILAGLKEYYKGNPVAFVTDWGMTFDPRLAEIGMPTVVPFVLFGKQRDFIEFVHAAWRGREDALVEKSRDMGVSWLCVAAAALSLAVFHGLFSSCQPLQLASAIASSSSDGTSLRKAGV